MSDTFRGAIKYIDIQTNEETVRYTKPYKSKGAASAAATRYKNQNKRIGNRHHLAPEPNPHYPRWSSDEFVLRTVFDTFFEFDSKWIEEPIGWRPV